MIDGTFVVSLTAAAQDDLFARAHEIRGRTRCPGLGISGVRHSGQKAPNYIQKTARVSINIFDADSKLEFRPF
jgi:hypothetical protein